MSKGNLYLIPVTLGDTTTKRVLPAYNLEIINPLDTFIVENIRSARRFLKKAGIKKTIDDLTFFELNKRTDDFQKSQYINLLLNGVNVGLLSEAGCPAIADPGAEIVSLAQQQNIRVIPLVGPSSILLSLMASGFNGQNFCFNGYLPKDQKERIKKIKDLERISISKKQTQLFIETPYRNKNVFDDLLKNCDVRTQLCVAVDITLPKEQILTKSIGEWKKITIDLRKRPCIFLIG